MTSTSFNTGYSLQRNSSKVIQPPGGQTTDIFGARSEPSYSSASSQAGSDVASSRIHLEQSDSSSVVVDGIVKPGLQHQQQHLLQQSSTGQVSPSGSMASSLASGQQQALLMADNQQTIGQQQQQQHPIDPATIQLLQQQQQQQLQQQQPMSIQQQKLIQLQQQDAVNRSPKKTIPVLRRNPITGEILENPGDRQPAVIRVRQPPGGRSSGIF